MLKIAKFVIIPPLMMGEIQELVNQSASCRKENLKALKFRIAHIMAHSVHNNGWFNRTNCKVIVDFMIENPGKQIPMEITNIILE